MRDSGIIEVRKCQHCGCQFGVNSRQLRAKFCDGCKAAAKTERQKKYYEDNKDVIKARQKKYNRKRPKRVITCVRCGQNFKLWRGVTDVCRGCLINGSAADRKRGYLRAIVD